MSFRLKTMAAGLAVPRRRHLGRKNAALGLQEQNSMTTPAMSTLSAGHSVQFNEPHLTHCARQWLQRSQPEKDAVVRPRCVTWVRECQPLRLASQRIRLGKREEYSLGSGHP